jgi:hypothetical protein
VQSVSFYLGVAALLFGLYAGWFQSAATFARRAFAAVFLAIALLAFNGWLAAYRDGLVRKPRFAAHNRAMLHAMERLAVAPDDPNLRFVFFAPEQLPQRVAKLRACGLLRLPWAEPNP